MDCSGFRDDMMDVLYGEADAEVAARFEAHRLACRECRQELSSLEGVRRDLQAWSVDARPARASRWALPSQRYLAAAAALVIAFLTGLGVARTEIAVRDGALVVRYAPSGRTAVPADVAAELARHEAEHKAEIEAVKASFGAPRATTPDETALLRQVRQMLNESEARQAAVMQSGLAELAQRSEAQRRYDLARISAGLSYLESRTASDVARTSEQMKNVLRISQDEGK